MALLDLNGLARLVEKIRVYFLDKDTYNGFAEYQIVPSEGIQLKPGASVMYIGYDRYCGIYRQKEVLLTPMESDYIISLMNPVIDGSRVVMNITDYFVEGHNNEKGVVILWKYETFYNWDT